MCVKWYSWDSNVVPLTVSETERNFRILNTKQFTKNLLPFVLKPSTFDVRFCFTRWEFFFFFVLSFYKSVGIHLLQPFCYLWKQEQGLELMCHTAIKWFNFSVRVSCPSKLKFFYQFYTVFMQDYFTYF